MRKKQFRAFCALLLAISATLTSTLADEILLPPESQSEMTAADSDNTVLPPDVQGNASNSDSATIDNTEAEAATSQQMVLIGLAYGSNALDGANLANKSGSGYRLGYLDADRGFVSLGYTSETSISVVKTQNVWYGIDPNYSQSLRCYSDAVNSDIGVGCWHVQLPTELEPTTFEEASTLAQLSGGFPAWINGVWQVRLGAYLTKDEAQAVAETVGGSVVGTSAYGVSVVKTGTANVLFQFDDGADASLTVAPGMEQSLKVETYYRGSAYYGMFQFRRVNGGDLTVINALSLDDYTNCVITQEMSPSWPLEALKAQAVCARTYWEAHKNKHGSNGFDLCATTHCQAYPGMGAVNERTTQAIAETSGQRIWYEGKPIDAVYFSSDGGATENVENVWGGTYGYLRGVVDPYEATIADKISNWKWSYTFTAAELAEILHKNNYNCAAITEVKVEHTEMGNVKRLIFVDANGKSWPFTRQSGVRDMLGLRSMRYDVVTEGDSVGGVYYTDSGETLSSISGAYAIGGDGTTKKISGNPYVITAEGTQYLPAPYGGTTTNTGELRFTFNGSGWGHNLGMSQWGAYAMAKQGFTYNQILTFYYTGVEIY